MTKAIFAALLGALFIGCTVTSNVQKSSAGAFENSSWVLVSISDKSLNVQKAPVIQFLDKKRVAGFNGVNSFGANYELSNSKIIFSNMISTRMASLSPELSKLEMDFTNTLLNANSFELNSVTLTISGANNTLIFKKTE
ncbi:MAG: META domain-containing protein [Campylobacteraceae bacterium]|jgi:heat shock protein HslJ|nr:META domain-containing protein [Campylobacteraceae bacterium]